MSHQAKTKWVERESDLRNGVVPYISEEEAIDSVFSGLTSDGEKGRRDFLEQKKRP